MENVKKHKSHDLPAQNYETIHNQCFVMQEGTGETTPAASVA